MTNNQALDFLGRCIGLGHCSNIEYIVNAVSSDKVDWYLVTYYADKHLIIPTIFYKLKKYNLLHLLPEELSAHFESIYKMNLERNLELKKQAFEITALLNSVGIVPIFMKGTANILDGVYDDIGERIVGDIDFLVSDDNFLNAAEILERDGYGYSDKYSFLKIDIKMVKHFPRQFKEGKIFDVEVHRLPVELKTSKYFNYDVVKPELKLLHENNLRFYVCSDRHKVVMAFIHGQIIDKGSFYAFVNLRNLYDMLALSQRVNISTVLREFGHYKNQSNNYLTISNLLLSTNPTFEVDKTIRSIIFVYRNRFLAKSEIGYNLSRKFLYFIYRVYEGYIKITFKAIFSPSHRKYLWIRVSDLKWYKEHLNSWKQK